MEKIYNYINGDLVKPKEDAWLENYNPAIGEVYSFIPDSDGQDVDSAYKAAQEAFPLWSKKTLKERSDVLQKIADLIIKNSNIEFNNVHFKYETTNEKALKDINLNIKGNTDEENFGPATLPQHETTP